MIKYILLSVYILILAVLFISLIKYPLVRRKMLHIGLFGLWVLLINFIWPIWLVIVIAIIGALAATIGFITIDHRTDILIYAGYLVVGVIFYLVKPEYIIYFTIGLAILSLADGLAALIGQINPENTISDYNDKTIYGSLTMFLVTAIILIVMQFDWPVALLGATILTVAEYMADDFDNLIIILCATVLCAICL